MFKSFFDWLDKLITEFSFKRLLLVLSFLSLVGLCIWAFEANTNYLLMNKLERSAKLVQELSELKGDTNVQGDPHLKSSYDAIARELDGSLNPTGYIEIRDKFYKAFSGASLWLLIALVYLRKREVTTTTGLVIFGGIAGLICVLLPDAPWLWINYVVYPLMIFLGTLASIVLWERRKNKKVVAKTKAA